MNLPDVKVSGRPGAKKCKRIVLALGLALGFGIWISWVSRATPVATLREHPKETECVEFSPRGDTLASATYDDGMIRIWDVENRKAVDWLCGRGSLFSLSCSPDGKSLASGGQGGVVKVWNIEHGQVEQRFDAHHPIESVDYSPHGKSVVSAGFDLDRQYYAAEAWDVSTGTLTVMAPHSGPVRFACYSPDGQAIASGSEDGTIKLSNAQTGSELQSFTAPGKPVMCVAFSPDGSTLAAAVGNQVILWKLRSGQIVGSLSGHKRGVKCVEFSPDGDALASCSPDGAIKLWNLKTGVLLRTFHHRGACTLAFSRDGSTLATGGQDVKLWDWAKDR